MMISPDYYVKTLKNKSYKQLLIERNKLLNDIYSFENESNNNMIDKQIFSPSPDVIYQMKLNYLAKICELIVKKHNN